ncbi:hypothetical protein [Saezia sanguinis]|nr:hypothetical protein [Saezia sanguinis]
MMDAQWRRSCAWLLLALVLVLLMGGCRQEQQGHWEPVTPLPVISRIDAAVLIQPGAYSGLAGGKVLVLGSRKAGDEPPRFEEQAAIYDQQANQWQSVAVMHEPRYGYQALSLIGGHVLVVGGMQMRDGRPYSVEHLEVYDPQENSWAVVEPPHAMEPHGAVALPDGRALVVGRRLLRGAVGEPMGMAAIYDPVARLWQQISPYADEATVFAPHLQLLQDGRVWLFGVSDMRMARESVLMYDLQEGRWTQAMPWKHVWQKFGQAMLHDGRVMLAGGIGKMDLIGDDAEVIGACALFDPASGKWQEGEPMLQPRVNHSTTLLADGRVLVAGGRAQQLRYDQAPQSSALSAVEIYDPVLRRWEVGVPLPQARAGHHALLLPDQRVLVIGGVGSDGTPLPALLYEEK